MNINGATGPGISTAVWSATTRKLTSIAGAMSRTGDANATIAASATVDLRCGANLSRDVTVGYQTANVAGAAGQVVIWDGTTTIAASIGASTILAQNQSLITYSVGTTDTVGLQIRNNGTQTNNWMACIRDWNVA
jgi:hypothetical protein